MSKMKITKRQLRRIIREVGRSEHDAEASGMAAAYNQGYNDAYRGPGYKKRGNREYLRGYQQGVADVEQGKPPPDDFRPARRIREAEGSTKKYDDDSALKGGQSKLPDGLQKGIIDKTVEDREDREEEEREEKNESARITRRWLRKIIKEAIDPREMEEPLGGWAGNALTNDPELDPFRDYSDEAVKAAAYAVEKVPYPQGGMIENEIHSYLEETLGLSGTSDEIFNIADEALSVAGIMLGVGPDAL
jgi:hypothetical protein